MEAELVGLDDPELDGFVAQGIAAIEALLAKHAAFWAYLGED